MPAVNTLADWVTPKSKGGRMRTSAIDMRSDNSKVVIMERIITLTKLRPNPAGLTFCQVHWPSLEI